VDADYALLGSEAVVPLDNDGDLLVEMLNVGLGDWQTEAPQDGKTEVLVLGVGFEIAQWRFQYVCGGRAAGGDAPSPILLRERDFRLSASETELSAVAWSAPGASIGPQPGESLGDIRRRKPFYPVQRSTEDGFDAIGRDELNSPGAIFADGAD
jgi:hypothetical protein